MKKLLGFALVLMLIIISVPIQATMNQEDYALKLKEIGVFKGTGNGFELDREPTRLEGIVMLIRLLGAEQTALDNYSNQISVFNDVPSWGIPYVNYAYENGLTKGIGSGSFGSYQTIDARSYLTFVLRALGYDDSTGDFEWSTAINDAFSLNVITDNVYSELKTDNFVRGDVAECSYLALKTYLKDTSTLLAEKLVNNGSMSHNTAIKIGLISASVELEELEVHFIDVGAANAILLIIGSDAMVIDAGNNSDGETVVQYIKDQDINEIDYLIGTHLHADHIGGIDDVINNFNIGTFMLPEDTTDTVTYQDVLTAASKVNEDIINPVAGTWYKLGDADFQIIGPVKDYDDTNNMSIVLRLEHGNNSFIFSGDAERSSELDIISAGYDVDVDILTVSHHGSSSSSSTEWLSYTTPIEGAVIMTDGIKYSHPHSETMAKLEEELIPVYRTDESGHIIVISNGESYSFNTAPDSYKPGEGSEITSDNSIIVDDSGLVISSLDKIAEVITITNNSEDDINLEGYYIVSVRGNQTYTFPSYVLAAGTSVTVSSGGSNSGILQWGAANIWNNSESDPAELYSPENQLVDTK